MNRHLMEAIVRHVFANFVIIPSDFVNFNRSKSLMDKEFLLSDHIPFIGEDGQITKNRVWGCQLVSDQQEIKIFLGDCSQEKDTPEYALLICVKNAPSYGIYLVVSEEVDSEPAIGVSMDGKNWIECSTYLQGTFLAGMEQIKDLGLGYTKCLDYKEDLEKLLCFIKFHHSLYEDRYEGQEG